MTVASTLIVRARAEGFLTRVRTAFATPVLTVDGAETELGWLGEHRVVVTPGVHRIGVHVRRRRSTRWHSEIAATVGHGVVLTLDAVVDGESFTLSLKEAAA